MSGERHEEVSLELATIEGTGLRFQGHSGPYTVTLDSGAAAQAPNPVRMMMLALGACTGMDVISILRKRRQVVTGYEIAVSGTRKADHPRIFVTLEVVHRVRGQGLEAAVVEEAVRLSATKYCTVSAQIGSTVAITHRVEILPA
ncbi:MAG TPA: OsmC family protein [Candidatus Eisenbacteria bacterium]